MAKESVVSTLEILFGGTVTTALTTLSAASLLVFSLLYSPCVAAIASIRESWVQSGQSACAFAVCDCMGGSIYCKSYWTARDVKKLIE